MSEDIVFYRTSYDEPESWFVLEARRDGRIDIRFGPGSIPAVVALIRAWEHVFATLPATQPVTILADMTEAAHASLRVQYMIGRWLLDHKARLHKIAVHGAGALQVAIVSSVMAVARIHRIKFFTGKDAAVAWTAD